MKISEVRKLARAVIRESEQDCSAAHEMEDELYLLVLQSIANGECEDPRAIAKSALKTQDTFIERFY